MHGYLQNTAEQLPVAILCWFLC